MRLRFASRALLAFALLVLAAAWLRADPALPPKPALYFNDGAGIVDAGTASELNEQLAQFERDTSSQIVVAIYPSLPDGADLSDYCIRTANSWVIDKNKYGQLTGGSRSAALFVFVNDHKLFIATGRDLEGALPDITCKQIIDNEITPRFKQGDFAGGLRAGVAAMMAATKGEYKGTGQTALEQQQTRQDYPDYSGYLVLGIFVFVLFLNFYFRGFNSSTVYTNAGRSVGALGGGFFGGGFGGGGGVGGSGFGGGGGGSSGFGGFSGGGGGGFGGGGAGGSW